MLRRRFKQGTQAVGRFARLGSAYDDGYTGSGEERDLLSSGNGCHCVDGRDTRLDHFLGVDSLAWVDWLTL